MTNPGNIWTGRTLDAIKASLAPCFADNCPASNLTVLQFAHLKPTTLKGRERGRIERLLDILAHPESYTLLCETHHEDFDIEFAQTGEHSWIPKSLLDADLLRGYNYRLFPKVIVVQLGESR